MNDGDDGEGGDNVEEACTVTTRVGSHPQSPCRPPTECSCRVLCRMIMHMTPAVTLDVGACRRNSRPIYVIQGASPYP